MIKKLSKKSKILIIAAIIILLLVLVVVIVSVLLNKETLTGYANNPEGIEIKNEFEELNNEVSDDGRTYPEVNIPANNILKYTTINEVLNIMNSTGDAVIYFGYPTCIYCRNAIQVLMDTAVDTELDVIYYLNIDENDSKYQELVEALGEELIVEEDGVKKVYIPLVVFITDGKVISYNKGTLFSQQDPYQTLDDSQVQGLSEIYRYGINDVVSSKNLKKQ